VPRPGWAGNSRIGPSYKAIAAFGDFKERMAQKGLDAESRPFVGLVAGRPPSLLLTAFACELGAGRRRISKAPFLPASRAALAAFAHI